MQGALGTAKVDITMAERSTKRTHPTLRIFSPPFTVEPVLVDTPEALRQRCERWMDATALGIDTEFVRDRSFFPRLGLIQVGDGSECALIDPLALEDLDPLWRVFEARHVVKVLHSCGEDLETFFHRFGDVPRPLFDTQIAAALLGFGPSVGYRNLVLKQSNIDLPKGETRSNWLQRPLTDAQKIYGALDVAYLPPIYLQLRNELRRRDRMHWLEQELEQLMDTERFLPDPDTLYLKIGHPGMAPRNLEILRRLTAWREHQARERDLPRNFVVPKAALVQIALKTPRNRHQLEKLQSIKPPVVRRHGNAILGIVRAALDTPPSDMPCRIPRPLDLSPHRPKVQDLRRAVANRASELDIPPEMLANKRTVERLVRRRVRGKEPAVPEDFTPWRREILTPLVDAVPP